MLMNEDIIKILSYFDLSESEAKVYLAALKVGKGTAYEITKVTNLKRPTVYVIIDSLVQKGLITTQPQKGRTLCLPVAPRRLVDMWKGRVESLEAIQPDLNVFYRQSEIQPKVQIFEGEKGVDSVYNELPPLESKGDEILLFGSIRAIENGFNYLFPRWERAFKNKKNKVKELLNAEPDLENYLNQRTILDNPNYEIRVMDNDVFGKTDNIIFQDKLAIFSLDKELFVTTIQSEEIVKTYRALFDAAWASAKIIK